MSSYSFMQFHMISCNFMQFHMISCDCKRFQAIPCVVSFDFIWFHKISCCFMSNFMRFHVWFRATLCNMNFMRFHATWISSFRVPSLLDHQFSNHLETFSPDKSVAHLKTVSVVTISDPSSCCFAALAEWSIVHTLYTTDFTVMEKFVDGKQLDILLPKEWGFLKDVATKRKRQCLLGATVNRTALTLKP